MPALLGKVPRTRGGQRFFKEFIDFGKDVVDTGLNLVTGLADEALGKNQ